MKINCEMNYILQNLLHDYSIDGVLFDTNTVYDI